MLAGWRGEGAAAIDAWYLNSSFAAASPRYT